MRTLMPQIYFHRGFDPQELSSADIYESHCYKSLQCISDYIKGKQHKGSIYCKTNAYLTGMQYLKEKGLLHEYNAAWPSIFHIQMVTCRE